VSGAEEPVKGSPAPTGRCPGGFSNCRGKCYDLKMDQNNCGACGVVCPAGKTCCNGTCNGPDTYADDRTNCGACGHACSGSDLCCNGSCVAQSADHCGACGTSCEGDSQCCGGVCKCGNCAVGTSCAAGSVCVGGSCDCEPLHQRCDDGTCLSCLTGPDSFRQFDPQACTCVCPITNSCGPGQTFDAVTCSCTCNDSSTLPCGAECCGSGAACAQVGGSGFDHFHCVIG
jgi:hypothetical protein